MIHWGELGRKAEIGRGDGFAREEDIPHITPTERGVFYASRSRSVYDTYRPSAAPVTPPTPTLLKVPLLAPDARHVLQAWFDQYARPEAEQKDSQNQFFGSNIPNGTGIDRLQLAAANENFTTTQEPVEIQEINLRINENSLAHHTSDFDICERRNNPHLVLRRGQPFEIEISFRRDWNPAVDQLSFVFEMGPLPRESQGTRIVLKIDEPSTKNGIQFEWKAKFTKVSAKEGTVSISIPSNAIVGSWNMKAVTSVIPMENHEIPGEAVEYVYPVYGIHVLFNPWDKNDFVFMPDETERDEYVLNEVGKIWRGSHNSVKPTYWTYGQHDEAVLEACTMLLDKSKLPHPMRSSPLHVARAISAMVNAPDDDGVLIGNWGTDFRNGTPPTEWTGSAEILREFVKLQHPVCYGQCWVFAGVVTSILRCLGIPCRTVTNFASAHDTESSITVNFHVDQDGRPIKQYNLDSVWSYHVWNDCWMQRPDLPAGYGGWQALDATPQQKSDGILRAGPASLKAIRNCDVGFGNDTAFIFAEVNAEKNYWIHNGSGLKFVSRDKKSVGQSISTKKPGRILAKLNEDRMDITQDYKTKEGIAEERKTLANALFTGGCHNICAHQDEIQKNGDVDLRLDLQESVLIGEDFHVTLNIQNKSKQRRTIEINFRIDATLYTGIESRKVKSEKLLIIAEPERDTMAQTVVTVREYLPKLLDQAAFLITCLAKVNETDQIFVQSDDFRVRMPDIKLNVAEDHALVVNKPFTLHAELKNPLPVQLTNCKFIIDGPGLIEAKEIPCKLIVPHGIAKVSCQVNPWKAGQRTLIARFASAQLQDVDGSLTVTVRSF